MVPQGRKYAQALIKVFRFCPECEREVTQAQATFIQSSHKLHILTSSLMTLFLSLWSLWKHTNILVSSSRLARPGAGFEIAADQ